MSKENEESPIFSFLQKKLKVKNESFEMKEIQTSLLQKEEGSPITKSKIYDPFAYPPNLKMAKEHGVARRVAVPPHLYDDLVGGQPFPQESTDTNKNVDVCDCCGYPTLNKYY